MIQQFFRTGRNRNTKRTNDNPDPPIDGIWIGDCSVCRSIFNYKNVIVISPFDSRVGGFCYRCHQEFCLQDVSWEKTKIKNPVNNEVYDGFNAICPRCKILLNDYQPVFREIVEMSKKDANEALSSFKELLEIMESRDDNKKEIQRLKNIYQELNS